MLHVIIVKLDIARNDADMTEWLARQLLEDRKRAKQREANRPRRSRIENNFDPFQVTNWKIVAGGDLGYLPKTPMRMGKEGFWIACRACGKKFESEGFAYCEPCMRLPSEERHAMKPSGRECEAPGCSNVIAPTARADTRYCSKACRERARYHVKRQKNDDQAPDIGPPKNLADTCEIPQQNQGAKIEDEKTDHFEHLRGDAVLSNWKPSPNINPANVPDIPDFLKR